VIDLQDQMIVDDTLKDEAKEECSESPAILEEITLEEMAVDGICGIY
jgi:mycofactocin precursor